MRTGPFTSEKEACEALVAVFNQESPRQLVIGALHKDVHLTTKWHLADGIDAVVKHIWRDPEVNAIEVMMCVSVLAHVRTEDGSRHPLCCSVDLRNPLRVSVETYLRLEDGWIRDIFRYSVWLDPDCPFPERVHATAERLFGRGLRVACPVTYR